MLEMPNVCAEDMPFVLRSTVHNPSALGLDILHMSMRLRLEGQTDHIGTSEFSPLLNGGRQLKPGDNALVVNSTFHIDSVEVLGLLVHHLLSDHERVPMFWDFTMRFRTNAFWFPVTITTRGTQFFLLNDPEQNELDRVQRNEPPQPSPRLLRASLHTIANTLQHVFPASSALPFHDFEQGLNVQSTFRFYPRRLQLQLPSLSLRVASNLSHLAWVTLEPFPYQWESEGSLSVDMPGLSPQALTVAQELCAQFFRNDTVRIQLQGAQGNSTQWIGAPPPTAIPFVDSTCIAQAALDAMPPALLEVIPQPFQPVSADNAVPASAPSTTELLELAVQNVTRAQDPVDPVGRFQGDPPAMQTLAFVLLPTLRLTADFTVTGQLPVLYLSLRRRLHVTALESEELVYVAVSLPPIAVEQWERGSGNLSALLANLTARVAATNESRFLTVVTKGEAENSQWVLGGREGHNLISTLLASCEWNITEPKASLPSTAAFGSPSSLESVPGNGSARVNLDYNDSALWLSLDLHAEAFKTDFVLYIPAMSAALWRQSEDVVEEHTLGLNMEALTLGQPAAQPWVEFVALATRDSSSALGEMVNAFVNDHTVNTTLRSSSASLPSSPCHSVACERAGPVLHVDVASSLRLQDVKDNMDTSTSEDKEEEEEEKELSKLDFGVATASSLSLEHWSRVALPSWHEIGFNVTLAMQRLRDLGFTVYGRLCGVEALLNADGKQVMKASTEPITVALPPGALSLGGPWRGEVKEDANQSMDRFSLALQAGTSRERALVRTLGFADIAPDKVFLKFATDGSVLSSILSPIVVKITAKANNASIVDRAGGGSAEVTVTSDAISARVAVTVVLPNVSLPLQLLVPELNAVLNRLDTMVAGDTPATVDVQVFTAHMSSLRFCTANCPNELNMTVDFDGSEDVASKLPIFVRDFLEQDLPLPVEVHGNAGSAPVSLRFFANSSEWRVNEKTPEEEEEETDANSAIKMNAVHLLHHATDPSLPMEFPCVLAGTSFCPYDTTKLSATPVRVDLNITLPDLPLSLRFWSPMLSFEVDCCVHEPLIRLGFEGNLDSAAAFTVLETTLEPLDLSALWSAVNDLKEDLMPVTFRIHGSTEGNYASALFSKYEYLLEVPPDVPTDTTPPPLLRRGLDLGVEYTLVQTGENFAEFEVKPHLDSPLSFPVTLGDGNLEATCEYTDVEAASIAMHANVKPGFNEFTALLRLFGQDQLTSRCSSAPIDNKRMCVVNELISALIGRNDPDGTDVTVRIAFTDVYGSSRVLVVHFTMFAENPHLRERRQDSELGLMHDFDVNMGGTTWGFISGIGSGSFEAHLILYLKNVFNFTLTITHVQLDFLLNDFDGVGEYAWMGVLGWHTLASNNAYMVAAGIETSPPNMELAPDEVGSSELIVAVPWGGVFEKALRLYDDYGVRDRMCGHLRQASLRVKVQKDGLPLIYTQQFSVDDVSIIGYNDCDQPPSCSAALVQQWGLPFTSTYFTTVGDARFVSGGQVEVTYDDDQVGGVWLKTKQLVATEWVARFSFRMHDASYLGHADGLVFVVQDQSAAALGTACDSGICHGYKGIGSSLAVVFDCYRVNEVPIFVNGVAEGNQRGNTETPPEFDDDNWHTAVVSFNSLLNKVWVFIDNLPIVSADVQISELGSASWDGFAWVGFTGSTGDWWYQTTVVKDFTWSRVAASTQHSFVREDGRVRGRVGSEGHFSIDARDSCGSARMSGGDAWTLSLEPAAGGSFGVDGIVDHHDGLYAVTFTSAVEGVLNVRGGLPGQTSALLGSIVVEPA